MASIPTSDMVIPRPISAPVEALQDVLASLQVPQEDRDTADRAIAGIATVFHHQDDIQTALDATSSRAIFGLADALHFALSKAEANGEGDDVNALKDYTHAILSDTSRTMAFLCKRPAQATISAPSEFDAAGIDLANSPYQPFDFMTRPNRFGAIENMVPKEELNLQDMEEFVDAYKELRTGKDLPPHIRHQESVVFCS
ncbi:hypothetical protein K491DRAFT_720241 [Lophiostoma macrostomum CBS 122681]|uniref:Uncharacterized protein n=1 Tax=Lophiostoma macrostomum CBS 122681 TaxID=1314788 RepID=A0A6A6SVF7_9PLEO|nr:hypothetical protein K491DRAFT_720241 [Lophiostoma macrostomum CBS 122681]